MAASKQKAQAPGIEHYSCYLQVLATDVDHSSPSLLLFLDKEGRMLFNAGEGLQRMFRENKTKMQKLETYFFTRASTETMSGLPGMLLSSGAPPGPVDAGGLLESAPTCTIYGPVGTKKYISAFQSYINQEQALSVHEFSANSQQQTEQQQQQQQQQAQQGQQRQQQAQSGAAPPLLQSKFLTVTPVAIKPSSSTAGRHLEGPSDSADAPEPKRAKLSHHTEQATESSKDWPEGGQKGAEAEGNEVDIHWPGTGAEAATPQAESVCYVCEMAGTPGKFDPKRAKELGVPHPKLYGVLQRGDVVALDDGTVIEPNQVMAGAAPGPLLIVVDVPTEQHLDALVSQQPLAKWLASSSKDPNGLCTIAHLSPPHMVSHPRYQEWAASLGSHWHHILCSQGAQAVTLRRATTLQAKLNCISPTLYPLLQPANIGYQRSTGHSSSSSSGKGPQDTQQSGHHTALQGDGTRQECSEQQASSSGGGLQNAQAASNGSQPAGQQGQGHHADASLLQGVEPTKVILGSNLLRFQLQPPKARGLDRSECEDPQKGMPAIGAVQQETRATTLAHDSMAAALATMEARKQQAASGTEPAPEQLCKLSRQSAEITFLGTASSCPSKYRNVTALYVDFFQRGGMLLDCGEDALGQMKRRYGCLDAERRVRELRCIWISHMHADHHGGLYRLLELRAQLLGAQVMPILVVGPPPLFRVLRQYQEVVPLPFHFLFNSHLLPSYTGRAPPGPVLQAFVEAKQQLGLSQIQPFMVNHIPHSYGVVLEGVEGWRVVFSGDTRPCDQTVEAARDSTLLIHEATFEDDMGEDALKKRHSTTGEALSIAEKAHAYRVLLTHFSTRYPKMPELDLSAHPNMSVAMDFMTINLADLQWLPSVTPALAALFKLEEQEWQQEEEEARS